MTSTTARIRTAVAVAAAAGTLAVALAQPAAAKGSDAVRATGSCSNGAHWELTAKHDDGRIEVEWEVDQNRAGVLWTWSLTDNGVRVGIGQRRTVAPSGSFTVHARIADRPGADRVLARALLPTGAVCQGVVTV